MKLPSCIRLTTLTLLACAMSIPAAQAEMAKEVSQYGITWTFDKPHEVGQFISGDWWVVGPVTVVSVSPEPGASTSDQATNAKSIYGATSLVDDHTMRNGSMVNPGLRSDGSGTSLGKQGFDSRSKSYDAALTVKFPLDLKPNDTLLSSISSETFDNKGKLTTPYVVGMGGDVLAKAKETAALETVSVLTCLATKPPADAFRPPYAGDKKPIYQAKNLQWDKLPKLPTPSAKPDWDKMERVHERVWLEIPSSWLTQTMGPGANQPSYGREIQRLSSIATLMLMLDEPQAKKEKLMYDYIQWGIDLRGAIDAGRIWFSDGGHWQGRKWPILFASIMLDAPEMRDFPPLPASFKQVQPSEACPHPVTVFQEDLDTYYGKGANGQDVLWQIIWHTYPRETFQEKPEADYTKEDKQANGYRYINSASYVGIALAAQLMEAKAIWNHDAFFDYVDYYMSPEDTTPTPKWAPKGCVKTTDAFVEAMWNSYRKDVPKQADGKDNWKFVWTDAKARTGEWVENPKPE